MYIREYAQMAELVYAPVLGTGSRKGLEVRVLFWAHNFKKRTRTGRGRETGVSRGGSIETARFQRAKRREMSSSGHYAKNNNQKRKCKYQT